MTVTEKRIVKQEWYETEDSKTGWDSHGWVFDDNGQTMPNSWTITQYIKLDKFGNPYLGIVVKYSNK